MNYHTARKIIKPIPNILTVSRLVMTAVLLWMILYSPRVENYSLWFDWAFILFVYTGLTDVLDGKLARMFEVTSRFGRVVDPLADKILICGGFICFAIVSKPVIFPETLGRFWMNFLLYTAAAVVIIREIAVQYMRQTAESKGINFPANIWGKLKMFIQVFAIATVIIKTAHVPNAAWSQWFALITLLLMVIATVLSGIQYFRPAKLKQIFSSQN
jgi:CDP-diacylglycerol--glycerol-3-phosphate 3-phosphatidyltransferase